MTTLTDSKTRAGVLSFGILICLFARVYGQEQPPLALFKGYKETALTIGYNYNFGDKVDGERPKS